MRARNARVVCSRGGEFWTTQKQFWAWVRQGLIVITGERPLTGCFRGRREHLLVLLGHTVLDLGCPEHLEDALRSRRMRRCPRAKQVVLD